MIASATPPAVLRLACGSDVPHAIGTAVFNYYDMELGSITELATRPEPDTSGQLPDGLAWWVEFTSEDGRGRQLDGSRMCSIGYARRKGWLA